MIYKKLFGIEFNKKKFIIFLDENNRRTFLEMNEKGEYEYCMLEDFLVLSKIFNCNNPYLACDVSRFNFKECVKLAKNGVVTILAVIIASSNSSALATNIDYEVSENSIAISYSAPFTAKNEIDLTNAQELLYKFLDEIDLTEDLIIKAIDNNQNIPDNIKEIIKEDFKKHYKEHPNANYRIFYENIKRLTINFFTDEEYRKNFPTIPGSEAHFDFLSCAVNLRETSSKEILRHELAHTYQFIRLETEDSIFIVKNSNNRALTEGVTEIMHQRPMFGLYKKLKKVCEFLISISDFTFEEYTNKGIGYLITKCKQAYPDIDFDYISATLDTLLDAEIHQKVEVEKDSVEMYDELFKAALKKADVKTGYKPFALFLDCLIGVSDESIAKDYFESYTKELEKIGYFNTEQGKKIRNNIKKYGAIYEKANYIVYSPNHEFDTSLGIVNKNQTAQRISDDGTITNVDAVAYGRSINHILKIKAAICAPNIREMIINHLKDNEYISPNLYSPIPLYVHGKLLTTITTGDLSLQVGFTKNGEIGFIISDKKGKIIYKTKDNLMNLSNKVSLNHYMTPYIYYIEKLDLNDILNDDYLKKYQSEYIGFYNIDVIDDKIVISSSPIVTITGTEEGRPYRQNYKVSDCKVYVQGGRIFVGKSNYAHTKPVDYAVDMESVLKFANLLVDGIPCYTIKMYELESISKSYIEALSDETNVIKSDSDYYSYSDEISKIM